MRKPATALRPLWSGMLSFGLVSIPVELYPGTRAGGAALRMLGPDGTPLARRYYCPKDDVALDADELVRGYEWQPGHFVTVSDDELAALEPKKSRELDLQRFVTVDAIDPIYCERSFFLAPASESGKAYFLLSSIMERTKRAGIGSFVMRDREYWVAIVSDGALLRAQTLRFANEVRTFEGVGLPKKPKLARTLVQGFEKWIDGAKQKLDLDELRDESKEQLLQLVKEKQRHKRDLVESEVPDAESDNDAEIIDLMAALKRSLGASSNKPANKSKPARRAATRHAPRAKAG